jgi:excisionase family DNA binding protein
MKNKQPIHVDPIAVQLSEAAHLLNIAPATLLDLVHGGKIPHRKVGTKIHLFSIEQLKAWVEESASDPFQCRNQAA